MTQLLVVRRGPEDGDLVAKFGGRPVTPIERPMKWPACATCKKAMQYFGALKLPKTPDRGARLLQLFVCQNQPGLCDEWDAEAGGNRALPVPLDAGKFARVNPPAGGLALRECEYEAALVEAVEDGYEAARAAWAQASGRSVDDALGQLHGKPAWIQQDETPACARCQVPMTFVAELEEGPDPRTAMNFGGGRAYVFDCACGQARMLWQR